MSQLPDPNRSLLDTLASIRNCRTLDLRFCALLTGGASEMELALASGKALVPGLRDCVQV